MKNNLTTTNQNAKLALSKSKSLLNITNSLLAKKDIGQLIQSFKFKPFLKEKGYSNSVNSVVISLDGKTMVSGSDDNTIKIWDMQNGESLNTLKGHSDSVLSVAISPDGKTIVSGGRDGTIKLWDIQSGECIYTSYNMEDGSTITIFSDGSFNASEDNIDKFIRVNDIPLSCRKLTKKEIEYFCKIKYENKVTNSKISEIDNEIPF